MEQMEGVARWMSLSVGLRLHWHFFQSLIVRPGSCWMVSNLSVVRGDGVFMSKHAIYSASIRSISRQYDLTAREWQGLGWTGEFVEEVVFVRAAGGGGCGVQCTFLSLWRQVSADPVAWRVVVSAGLALAALSRLSNGVYCVFVVDWLFLEEAFVLRSSLSSLIINKQAFVTS